MIESMSGSIGARTATLFADHMQPSGSSRGRRPRLDAEVDGVACIANQPLSDRTLAPFIQQHFALYGSDGRI